MVTMPNIALRFDHLALRVRDPAATLSFYADTLGLPLIASFTGSDWDGADWLMMIFGLADGRQLACCALNGPFDIAVEHASDLPHYAFSVSGAAALQAWRERLKRRGVEFKEEDHGAQQSIYFKDPNGVTLEITAPASTLYEAGENPRATAGAWIATHWSAQPGPGH
jgi:glyoxylase I family protein